MTFLPIVARELRVQARQKRTFRLRLANATVAMALVAFMLLVNEGFATPGSPGHGLFTVMAWLGFIYCLLGGVGNTADCLSEEKREGTLGLLFLTDLKGYDVVLGKLLATSLNGFYGLIAIFPPLAITLCLGGVTAGEFWRLTLLLASTLFLSLAAGMFVSALSWDEQRAWAGAAALLALVSLAPGCAFYALFDAAYNSRSGLYWQALLVVHALSWVLLAAASALLPRSWQDRTASGDGALKRMSGAICEDGRTAPRWLVMVSRCDQVMPFRKAQKRERERENLLMINPVQWLACRQTDRAGLYLWAVVVLAGGVAAGTAIVGVGDEAVLFGLCGCALALHFLLAIWAAFQASFLLAAAKSSGTLELLMATPLTDGQIIDGYYFGLRRVFARPIAVLLAVESAILLGGVMALGMVNNNYSMGPWLVIGGGACMLLFLTDLFAVGRFGLWMGLITKKPGQAFMKTVLCVMVLPLFSFCCTLLMPLIWLLKNAILRSYGEEQMRRHLRAMVTEGLPQKKQPGRLPSVVEG